MEDSSNGGEQFRRGTRAFFDDHSALGSRYITKYTNFFDIYDRYLESMRDRPIRMIEIGVQHGGSLQMWKRYLHPESTVIGLDIYPACKQFEEDGIQILIGDQSDTNFLAEVAKAVGPVDFILDDASHIPRHQIASFNYLFPMALNEGGVYMVEDCFTSYWRRFGGGVRKRGTFIEYAKKVVDDINYWHWESRPSDPNWRNNIIESVEFHSAVVAFRKRNMARPQRIDIGDVMAVDLEAPFRDGPLGDLVVRAKQVPAVQAAVRRSPALWAIMKRMMR